MVSFILLSACILGALADDKGCIPANKCYIFTYAGNSGLSTKFSQISSQLVCRSNGTICRRNYGSSDCSEDFYYEYCYGISDPAYDYFMDHVDCSGTCTNYVHTRTFGVAHNDTDCSEIDTGYREDIFPLGCKDLTVGPATYYYQCTENTYQIIAYVGKTDDGVCLIDDGRVNAYLTQGCNINTTLNKPLYVEILHCGSDSSTSNSSNSSSNGSGRDYYLSVSMILTLFLLFYV